MSVTVASPARSSTTASTVGHHFTVDVEEYFQVSAFERFIAPAAWQAQESRVVPPMSLLLDLLDRYHARGTFFVLGWVAERRPALVRSIAERGHEVASHGWDHRRVTMQTPQEFRASIRRSRQHLEDIVGAPVIGFRAPTFSIVPGREWAFDLLLEEGYRYDSSLFPIVRPGYGYPGTRPEPHWIERAGGRLAEFPPATLKRWGIRLPSAGGAYFRLFPYAVTRAALAQCEHARHPGTFYIHPWELDPGQPRIRVPVLTRIRHYGGLSRVVPRLHRLLGEFRFPHTMAQTLESL